MLLLINHCGFTVGIAKSHIDPIQKTKTFLVFIRKKNPPQQTFTEFIFLSAPDFSLSVYFIQMWGEGES